MPNKSVSSCTVPRSSDSTVNVSADGVHVTNLNSSSYDTAESMRHTFYGNVGAAAHNASTNCAVAEVALCTDPSYSEDKSNTLNAFRMKRKRLFSTPLVVKYHSDFTIKRRRVYSTPQTPISRNQPHGRPPDGPGSA